LGGCTSIIAEDTTGGIHHVRNLDFGLGPYNASEQQWQLTDALRPLIVNVDYQQGGKSVFKGVHYVGYVGTLTAVKQGAFSITVDSRFDNSYDKFLLKWIKDPTDTANFLSFLTRQTIMGKTSFSDALDVLSNSVMVGPSYIILGGVKAGEGAIITNKPNTTRALDVWDLTKGKPDAAPYYLLQTNYDHWVAPPQFDNRRYAAEDCMNKLGQQGMTKENLYNVLHAHPSRNRLTTYTTLMSVADGTLENSIQYCVEAGCEPW